MPRPISKAFKRYRARQHESGAEKQGSFGPTGNGIEAHRLKRYDTANRKAGAASIKAAKSQHASDHSKAAKAHASAANYATKAKLDAHSSTHRAMVQTHQKMGHEIYAKSAGTTPDKVGGGKALRAFQAEPKSSSGVLGPRMNKTGPPGVDSRTRDGSKLGPGERAVYNGPKRGTVTKPDGPKGSVDHTVTQEHYRTHAVAQMKANNATAHARMADTPAAHKKAAVAHSKAFDTARAVGDHHAEDKHQHMVREHNRQGASAYEQKINDPHGVRASQERHAAAVKAGTAPATGSGGRVFERKHSQLGTPSEQWAHTKTLNARNATAEAHAREGPGRPHPAVEHAKAGTAHREAAKAHLANNDPKTARAHDEKASYHEEAAARKPKMHGPPKSSIQHDLASGPTENFQGRSNLSERHHRNASLTASAKADEATAKANRSGKFRDHAEAQDLHHKASKEWGDRYSAYTEPGKSKVDHHEKMQSHHAEKVRTAPDHPLKKANKGPDSAFKNHDAQHKAHFEAAQKPHGGLPMSDSSNRAAVASAKANAKPSLASHSNAAKFHAHASATHSDLATKAHKAGLPAQAAEHEGNAAYHKGQVDQHKKEAQEHSQRIHKLKKLGPGQHHGAGGRFVGVKGGAK